MFEKAKAENIRTKSIELFRTELQEAERARAPVFLTSILMLDEPYRTHCLMALDGHIVGAGGSPTVIPERAIRLPEVRLVTKKREDVITYHRFDNQRVPGTDRINYNVKVTVHAGNDATLPEPVARAVLMKHGFPVVDQRSNGARNGYVVELDWLMHEVTLPDCLPEFKKLAEEIKARLPPPKKPAA